MGASLLTLFLNWKVPQGFGTILIAHILFNISYVVVTVRARLVGFDRHLEEAAMDLGANEMVDVLPRHAAADRARDPRGAACSAFALSVDDFVITYFNAGTVTTFPLFVWGAARVAVPPQINVVGTAIFVIAVGGMLANVVVAEPPRAAARRRRMSPVEPRLPAWWLEQALARGGRCRARAGALPGTRPRTSRSSAAATPASGRRSPCASATRSCA